MSINSAINSAGSLTNQLNSGFGVVSTISSDLKRLGGGSAPQPPVAKFAYLRDVPFVATEGDGRFGRRNAVHEYPYRDTVWVEDLGRSARRINVRGYIVGDDCIAQRDRLIAACEQPGDATLRHPSYGELQGNLLGSLSIQERWDKRRMFEISFSFIVSGPQIFPASAAATGAATLAAAAASDAAAGASFVQTAVAALKSGASVVAAAVQQVKTWVSVAQRLANDATNLTNLVRQLPGDFGRFLGQISGGSRTTKGTTLAALIAQAAVARQNVAVAGSNLSTAAAGLSQASAATFVGAAQAQAAAVLAAVNDPADGIRLLQALAMPVTVAAAPSSPIGQSISAIQAATSDLFRRAAVVAIARASADFQPSSADDAAAVRVAIGAALDREITIAADQYEDATYNALRVLRAAVVADLNARGAGLPTTIAIATKLPLPALALAQRFYRDAGHADALTAQSGAVHPAFMPMSFRALA